MYRKAQEQLKEWAISDRRKPLILNGARQIGKTWLMKWLGGECFSDCAYFNFDKDSSLKAIFESDKDANRIIEKLSMIRGKAIVPGKTLIIFDEIQECSEALNSLKYFNEDAAQYHVISAGSLLGTLLAQPKSYPVGQVDILHLYPMDFEEFLFATEPDLWNVYNTITSPETADTAAILHDRFSEAYGKYLMIGGMPECVDLWRLNRDYKLVDRCQSNIIELYENDFCKHAGIVNSGKILTVFRNIVPQLAKENKKFIYGAIRSGARGRDYEDAIEWLVSAGIADKVNLCNNNIYPLASYDNIGAFKLYMMDVGLLKHMAGIGNDAIVLNKQFPFMGAMAENFVSQQFKNIFEIKPRYFTFGTRYETDFLVQYKTDIVPIEVKSGESVKSNSMTNYIKHYAPSLAIRYSKLGYKRDGMLVNIPLWLVHKTMELV